MKTQQPPTAESLAPLTGSAKWVEVDPTCFETKEKGGIYETTLLLNRCTQLKRSVRRVRDAITFTGESRADCDSQVAKFCERADVRRASFAERGAMQPDESR